MLQETYAGEAPGERSLFLLFPGPDGRQKEGLLYSWQQPLKNTGRSDGPLLRGRLVQQTSRSPSLATWGGFPPGHSLSLGLWEEYEDEAYLGPRMGRRAHS